MSSRFFSHRENRRWHMPPVSCSYCSKTFVSRQARRRHFSVHQEEVQFKRRRCAFSVSSFLANDNDSPPSPVNVGNNTANNLADVNSRLIVPSTLSPDSGCAEILRSHYSSMAPAAMASAGTMSLSPPISFPADASPFRGGFQFSLLTAGEGIFSRGPVNPLRNFLCPNLWNNVGDVGEDAEITNMPSNWLGIGSPQVVQPDEELILFKDVSGAIVLPDVEEVQDLDLSLHL